jgi:translocator protein
MKLAIPSWLIIGGITFLIASVVNRLSLDDRRWFGRLRRPQWLTFEWLIPFIWLFVFTCGAASANKVWQDNPNTRYTWLLMVGYIVWELAILAYTPVMCRQRSLKVGTSIGAIGFFVGLILAILVFFASPKAAVLLVPFLLWSPIGTFVTWQMIFLNPNDA